MLRATKSESARAPLRKKDICNRNCDNNMFGDINFVDVKISKTKD